MLNLESEKLLARLLYQVLQVESEVEQSRQELCSQPDFSVSSAFTRLDIAGVRLVSALHLQSFLNSSTSTSDIQQFINQYDSDRDGLLSLQDFSCLVLSSENSQLREMASRRETSLSFSTESLLKSHIQLEIEGQISLHKSKLALRNKTDPSIIFSALNPEGFYAIKPEQIQNFMRRNSYDLTIYDLEAIIRRIDIDADGLVCYSELSEFFHCQKQSPKKLGKAQKKGKKRVSRTREVKDEMMSVFCSQIENVRKFDRKKSELANQNDFNLLDFYRMIDMHDRGSFAIDDFRNFCYDLRVIYNENDLFLIFKHYGNRSSISLREFEKMWEPKDRHFAYVLAQRRPLEYLPVNRLECFSSLTIQLIAEAIQTLMECERTAEHIRQSVSPKTFINLMEVFKGYDRNQDGYITADDLSKEMKNSQIFISTEDLEGLVELYDKNLDNRISYSEFLQELTPNIK